MPNTVECWKKWCETTKLSGISQMCVGLWTVSTSTSRVFRILDHSISITRKISVRYYLQLSMLITISYMYIDVGTNGKVAAVFAKSTFNVALQNNSLNMYTGRRDFRRWWCLPIENQHFKTIFKMWPTNRETKDIQLQTLKGSSRCGKHIRHTCVEISNLWEAYSTLCTHNWTSGENYMCSSQLAKKNFHSYISIHSERYAGCWRVGGRKG